MSKWIKKIDPPKKTHTCYCGRLATIHIKSREWQCERCKRLENLRKFEEDHPHQVLSKYDLIWNLGLPVNL